MATCPECDAEIEVDEFDVDKGDLISCPDCGSNLEVTSTSPLELEPADDDDDDDDDDEEEMKKTKTSRATSWRTTTRSPGERTGTSDPRPCGHRQGDGRGVVFLDRHCEPARFQTEQTVLAAG